MATPEQHQSDIYGGIGDVPPLWFQRWHEEEFLPFAAIVDELCNYSESLGPRPLTEVPCTILRFENGEDPTRPPHNLPPLRNVDALAALTGPQATRYCKGYGLPVPHAVIKRRRALAQHIGCSEWKRLEGTLTK
ncbi:hypothetical protein FB451DRAFT_1183430 [Mycena latifolia]|nr:hypothetical protein FB451DRAFT_1183430 [Mycena latifolia]